MTEITDFNGLEVKSDSEIGDISRQNNTLGSALTVSHQLLRAATITGPADKELNCSP
jgi:hypothetical protein